jgi:hypothetical protein
MESVMFFGSVLLIAWQSRGTKVSSHDTIGWENHRCLAMNGLLNTTNIDSITYNGLDWFGGLDPKIVWTSERLHLKKFFHRGKERLNALDSPPLSGLFP